MKKKVKKLIHYLVALGAYWYYGRPANKLIVIGVTGTKGKSSTCRYIASVLSAGGEKVGLLTTVEFQIGDWHELNTKKMTMLGRGEIQKMLKKMVDNGCKYAVIETSSEGILQFRHIGLEYDICVFTNLGKEHSERHGGFENLRNDKAKIFSDLSKKKNKIIRGVEVKKIIIINGDDNNADYFYKYNVDKKYIYSLENNYNEKLPVKTDYLAKVITSDINGNIFTVNNQQYNLKIPGAFNVYNALPAIIIAKEYNTDDILINKGLESVTIIPGRMEFINQGQPFFVVVDYAHEIMSLSGLFIGLRKIIGKDNKLIGVIGSDGGGRDKSKRYEMGAITAKLCDIVVITDVNCFDEDPHEIAEMLANGARDQGKQDGVDLFIEVDRKKSFAKSFELLNSGDAVAFTAKGTEPCMVVAGGEKISWDDRVVAKEVLNEMGYKM